MAKGVLQIINQIQKRSYTVTSASRIATRYPSRASRDASTLVTKDLPTPPLPLHTPMTFFTLDFSCSGAMRDSCSDEPQEPPSVADGQEPFELQESQEPIFYSPRIILSGLTHARFTKSAASAFDAGTLETVLYDIQNRKANAPVAFVTLFRNFFPPLVDSQSAPPLHARPHPSSRATQLLVLRFSRNRSQLSLASKPEHGYARTRCP